jgi:hypothetical protein
LFLARVISSPTVFTGRLVRAVSTSAVTPIEAIGVMSLRASNFRFFCRCGKIA